MKHLSMKMGVNYAWGLFNYTLGVASGSFVGTLAAGAIYHVAHR